MRRLKLWEESLDELLADQMGRETLQKFLDKEYSGENLRFWMKVLLQIINNPTQAWTIRNTL